MYIGRRIDSVIIDIVIVVIFIVIVIVIVIFIVIVIVSDIIIVESLNTDGRVFDTLYLTLYIVYT